MSAIPTQWLSPNKRKFTLSLTALISIVLIILALGTMWHAASRARAASNCQVSYSVQSQWTGGFSAAVTITNTSPAAYSNWTLAFAFPSTSQTVTQGWNATWSQSGQNVTAASLSYNGALAVNASTNIGFNGTWSGSNSVPTSFTVNGQPCNGNTTPIPSTSTPSKTQTSTPATATATPVTKTPTPVTPTTTPPPGTSHTGNATHFDGLGSPYGGCGVPQSVLETQYFVALNVQNTPGDYSTMLTRPISAANASKIGMFNNGLNCGRWVQVTIGNYCTGTNDGAPNQPFCRNGSWVTDKYNGATLNMIVADSCQDGNAWCRDDPYHLDLVTSSLNNFLLNGQPVGDMDPAHWNNRQISWQFIPAPNYTGDIQIGFLQGAGPYWTAIDVTHLANGIHGIDYLQGGTWVKASMDSDMGNAYIVLPTTAGGSSYQIRVYDASDQLINNGRVYSFSFPSSCGTQCSTAYTSVTYTAG
jgi:Cellulose binding domain